MLRRWRRIGLVLALPLIAVAATTEILVLVANADRARTAELVTVKLNADTSRLGLVSGEAIGRGGFTPESAAASDVTRVRIDRNLHLLAGVATPGMIPLRIPDAVRRFERAVARMRSLLEVHNSTAAGVVVRREVGPTFARLAPLLARAGAAAARDSHESTSKATFGIAGVIAAATGCMLVLLWLRRRDARSAGVRIEYARTQAILEDSSDLITLVAADGRITSVSRSVEDILGFLPEELDGRPLTELVHPDDHALFAAVLARPAAGVRAQERVECRVKHRNGYWLHVESIVNNRLSDPRVRALVLTTRDVSDRKAFEEQLRHRAFHDPLTQLPNRALFHDRTQHALSREERYERHVAVLFVDLDDFKLVNDQLGHAAGDELLVAVAQRLRASLRSADTPARLGGDEFGVLIEGVAGPDQAMRAAQRVLDAFDEPFSLGGTPVSVRPSIGVALAGTEDTGVDELHRNADLAMYAAKTAGKGRIEQFHPQLHAELQRRFSNENEEPDRITWFVRSEEQRTEITRLLAERDSIVPVFQPILDLRSGQVAGYEALARFPTAPEPRPPNAWFAQAHRFDLGFALEAKALRAALAVPGRPAGSFLTVNVSPSALRSPECEELFETTDLSRIVVEITEHEMVLNSDWLQHGLEQLRRRGARVAVDDAGAGYAGMRQLMTLRPDIIKLDRQLVDGLAHDDAKRALTESVAHFAERIGATICAEGIEKLDDLDALAGLGIAFGQGYAIAHPAAPWATAAPDAVSLCRLAPTLASVTA